MTALVAAQADVRDSQTLNNGIGSEMAQRKVWNVVEGRRSGAQRVESICGAAEVREATTGRVVASLPRVWAVAAPSGRAVAAAEKPAAKAPDAGGMEVRFYRKYTEALLRRYMQMTFEAGRVPSIMGREVIGGKASSYRIHGFDDAVIFRLDVEKCLKRLEPAERDVLRRVVLQDYTQAEAAPLLGISLRTCVQRYGRSLDKLTEILLEVRLLEPFKALSSGRA